MQHKVDFIKKKNWQWPAQWVGLRRSSKARPKVKLASKKGHGHCLVVCSPFDHSGFLSPSQTITSEKYAQQIVSWTKKLQCLQLTLVNRMGPVLLHDNAWLHVAQLTLQKVNKLGYEGLPYPPSSPDLSPVATDFNFFKLLDNFLQGKCFHSQQEAENAFQEFVYSWSTDFYTTGINQLIFHWQKCVEPSYNDLNSGYETFITFMVPNTITQLQQLTLKMFQAGKWYD